MATNKHLNSNIRTLITMMQFIVVFAAVSITLFVGFHTIVNVWYSIVLTFVSLLGLVNVIWTAMEYTQKFVKGK